MIAIIQYVKDASVKIQDFTVASIKQGLLIYLGICKHDTQKDLEYVVNKLVRLKLIPDPDKDFKLGKSILEQQPEILVVSEVTLCADILHGSRISFSTAMEPTKAREFYEAFISTLQQYTDTVKTGKFGADMLVTSTNIGPVTFIIKSPKKS